MLICFPLCGLPHGMALWSVNRIHTAVPHSVSTRSSETGRSEQIQVPHFMWYMYAIYKNFTNDLEPLLWPWYTYMYVHVDMNYSSHNV